MRLSLTSWSFPSCTLREAADISRALGIGALDVGLFYRSALDKAEILADPRAAAERVKALGVALPNYYHLFGDSLADRNCALPGSIDANARDLDAVLTFADAANIGSVFVLPGIVIPVSRAPMRRAWPPMAFAPWRGSRAITRLGCVSSRTCIPGPKPGSRAPARRGYRRRSGARLCAFRLPRLSAGGSRSVGETRRARASASDADRVAAVEVRARRVEFPRDVRDAARRRLRWLDGDRICPSDYMNTLSEDVLTETIAMRDCFRQWQGGG